jgi:hypothetical protein
VQHLGSGLAARVVFLCVAGSFVDGQPATLHNHVLTRQEKTLQTDLTINMLTAVLYPTILLGSCA